MPPGDELGDQLLGDGPSLDEGAERRLTNLAPDFNVRDFDASPDGREIVLERVQERSNVVLIDLGPRD
jgi:hypothetical protein